MYTDVLEKGASRVWGELQDSLLHYRSSKEIDLI
jgi:hypothetical protein